MKLFYWITGGRPMHLIDPCRFIDIISGKSVGLYEDRFGRKHLAANGPWSRFRVEIPSAE